MRVNSLVVAVAWAVAILALSGLARAEGFVMGLPEGFTVNIPLPDHCIEHSSSSDMDLSDDIIVNPLDSSTRCKACDATSCGNFFGNALVTWAHGVIGVPVAIDSSRFQLRETTCFGEPCACSLARLPACIPCVNTTLGLDCSYMLSPAYDVPKVDVICDYLAIGSCPKRVAFEFDVSALGDSPAARAVIKAATSDILCRARIRPGNERSPAHGAVVAGYGPPRTVEEYNTLASAGSESPTSRWNAWLSWLRYTDEGHATITLAMLCVVLPFFAFIRWKEHELKRQAERPQGASPTTIAARDAARAKFAAIAAKPPTTAPEEDVPEAVQCIICMDRKINAVYRTCGHPFCDACAFAAPNATCATCRTPFKDSDVIPMFIQ